MNDRKYIFRRWCTNLKSKDFICLREIKVVGFQAHTILKILWDQATTFYSNHERRKGGFDILVGSNWVDYIVNRGVFPCHSSLWIVVFKDG